MEKINVDMEKFLPTSCVGNAITSEQYVEMLRAMAAFVEAYTTGCKTMLEMGLALGVEMRKRNSEAIECVPEEYKADKEV